MATMKDRAFLADAEKLKLDVSPSNGEGVEKLFARFFGYPKSAVDKAVASIAAAQADIDSNHDGLNGGKDAAAPVIDRKAIAERMKGKRA